jgi:predicted PurR-regulated permease PerM
VTPCLRSSARGGGSIASGALVAGEVIVGSLLSLVVTFFFLKDGRRFVDSAIRRFRPSHRDVARRAAERGWDGAGGYLRGAALLGIVESIAIGLAILLVGGRLVVPVMVLTFLAAFIPIVGALAAGIMAILVTLVTAGTVPALIVAAVALVVQQLDNDLLAPVVYGRALQLHPLVVLLGIAAGGSLFGFVGTFFAVPVLAGDAQRAGRDPPRPFRGRSGGAATLSAASAPSDAARWRAARAQR